MYRSDKSNTIDGINNNTYNVFFINEEKNANTKSDREFLYTAIQQFTKLKDFEMDKVIKNTDMFEKNDTLFTAKYKDLKYNFILLDSFLEENKEELRSNSRLGQCIYKSMTFAINYDGNCKIIVGYLDNNSDKILHAVFLEYDDNKEFVFDYTMNLIMKKEDYMELFDFKVINKIDGKDIKKDIYLLYSLEYISSKFYLCFRDEFINSLKKNNKILKLED